MKASSRYKNIIFDFGGVLVDLDKQLAIESFKRLGFDASPYLDLYAQSGIFSAHERGEICDEDFLDAIECYASREQKANAWLSMLTDVPIRRRETILRLRKTHRVFLLSNTNSLHWQMSLRKWWNTNGHTVDDYFEKTFLSFELHQCKPNTDIFKTAIYESGLNPEETLFIDDSQKNCDAAVTVGLQTLCATGDEWMGCVATIGHFDGVHIGHRFLIERVKDEAVKRGLWSMLITFDRHPQEIVNPDIVPQSLTPTQDKVRLLQESGVDEVEVLHFDQKMSQMSARTFLLFIKKELGVRVLLVGHDHHFGHNREETIEDYRNYGQEIGIEVLEVGIMPGVHVSSSKIRYLLQSGDVRQAAQLLGRPYALIGKVVMGHQIGRKIGFPTANIYINNQILPASGVYAGRWNGRTAAINIGCRPTIDKGDISVEVHIPGFKGNLYGQTLCVELLYRIRPERRFDSIEELQRQIELDIKNIKHHC